MWNYGKSKIFKNTLKFFEKHFFFFSLYFCKLYVKFNKFTKIINIEKKIFFTEFSRLN